MNRIVSKWRININAQVELVAYLLMSFLWCFPEINWMLKT
ncbi:hypothetical protein GXM_06656 [Nostoc sphaeroides CCNUC1]|uniref:Uncharacterized protein n=1 Tax=Nostoc sphaeroides CCNUC1 TaxID=2653204 RepID=A0A5P8W9D6_9NOSO|nr:hypothetical protein GXM_06656 [Nostoc sphaeroides CCNUC1]